MQTACLTASSRQGRRVPDEAMLLIEEISPERRNVWLELNNYIKALNEAIEACSLLCALSPAPCAICQCIKTNPWRKKIKFVEVRVRS